MCYDIAYGSYCMKAVLAYADREGDNLNTHKGVIIYSSAYFEHRRVVLHQRFGYYEGPATEIEVPKCMLDGTMKTSLDILNDLVLKNKLQKENDRGRLRYTAYKNNHKI